MSAYASGGVFRTPAVRGFQRWKDFDHPNVLPLLGIVKNFQDGIALVSPWMSNGAIDYYLRDNPTVDRLKLVCTETQGSYPFSPEINIIYRPRS